MFISLGDGWAIKDVAAALGVSRQSVSTWKARAGSRGEKAKALTAKPQHVPVCRLSKPQQERLKRLLRAGPRKAGFASDLWTLRRVAKLVEREFDISYHPSHLLHALGFSCQKPKRRSKEQDPEAVKPCREKKWPAIKKGEDDQASVVFIDESGFMLQPLLRRTWAQRGRTPVFDQWDRHDRTSVITALALSPKRRRVRMFFRLLDHNAKADDFIWFLNDLRLEIRRKLHVVWDNLGAHRRAENFLRTVDCQWACFHRLPAYAPELNPVEHVWSTS